MRNRWWFFVCPLVTACFVSVARAQVHRDADESEPAAVHSEDAHTADSGAEHNASGHDAETSPLLSFDPGSAVWTIVVFVLLLVVLRTTAWKPILAALNQREKFIHDSIADAKREREEADKLLGQYREQIDKAREEATDIVEEGKRDAEDVRRRIHEDARKESDQMIARARQEIDLAARNAIKELYDKTAELAVQAAGRVVGKTLSVEDHRALVNESLDRMKNEDASLN